MREKLLRHLMPALFLIVAGGAHAVGQERSQGGDPASVDLSHENLSLADSDSGPHQRNWTLFDLGLQQGWDDNATGTGQTAYSLEATPHLSFRQNRERGFWSVDYRSTFRRYQSLAIPDRFDHSLHVGGSVEFSPRWTADFYSQLLHSSNPFLRSQDVVAGGNAIFGRNPSFVGLARAFTSSDTSVSLHYQFGPHGWLHFNADYFRDDESDARLLSNDSRSFHVQYEKRYARNKTWGVLYSLQLFRTTAANLSVRTQSLLLTHGYEMGRGTRLELSGGPQFSVVQAQPTRNANFFFLQLPVAEPIREPITGFAAAVVLTQRVTNRTSMEFSVSRRIADGSGVTGTIVQNSFGLALRQQPTRRLSSVLSGYFTGNRGLSGAELRSPFQAWGFSAGTDFALARHASLTAEYDFSHNGAVPGTIRSLALHNRFVLGFRYSFGTFPIGR